MYLTRDEEPEEARLEALLERASMDKGGVEATVADVLDRVKREGDAALFDYERRFDGVSLSSLRVGKEEMDDAIALVDSRLMDALRHAARNIRAFHQAEMQKGESLEVEKGVSLSRKIVPISSVGLYIPGGTAPLFSTVLMLSIPAQVAGCRSIILCTPPSKDGTVNPAILAAASLGGVTEIYKVGGAQAIAAMAYGTESIPRVSKIFGPGNRFVMEAKMQASRYCAIDMPAGPSEVMVVADTSCNPAYVASDLLSQAEHGPDSQAMLILVGEGKEAFSFLDRVEDAIGTELSRLTRGKFLLSSLSHSHAIIVHDGKRAMEIANQYAPEHLIIATEDARFLCAMVENAGSVFLGPWSCESAGDYASGTNHTLPTNGWARSCSGVSTDSFLKKITVQELSREGLDSLADTIVTMAKGEHLDAHAEAVKVRMEGKR